MSPRDSGSTEVLLPDGTDPLQAMAVRYLYFFLNFVPFFSTSSVVCVVKVVSKSQVFIFIEPNDMTIGNDSDQTIDCKCYKMKY